MAKKVKFETKGDQVVNKADLNQIKDQFINFYYQNWFSNVASLFQSPIWKSYTKMMVDNVTLNPHQIINWHTNLSKGNFKIDRSQFIPDGGRRMDIMVQGTMTLAHESKKMIQNFVIIENGGKWWIKSILVYFI